jgi:hypothetical protein
MTKISLKHFQRAAADIAENGENDTLPFDMDRRFLEEKRDALAQLAFCYFQRLEKNGVPKAIEAVNSLDLFSERLLTPTGPTGFRITTKIHPFWNLYFNGMGVAIAEAHEPLRSLRARSYRFAAQGDGLFDRNASWRTYLQATLDDETIKDQQAVVVKTDISGFYEHVYHHRVENCIADLFPKDRSTISVQVDRFLNHFAAGRSFGLPVGGQCARILAELLMSAVDRKLSDAQITWYRYVDDFTLITANQAEAYRALSVLSHALADYGLSLNRTKTTILTAKHYADYVGLQLGAQDDEAGQLRQVDLYFDPYSDDPHADFDELRDTIAQIHVQKLLDLELEKSQPDAFIVSQISKTLRFHPSKVALQLCQTLLDPKNLHAFRGSWSTIMRGIATIRAEAAHADIAEQLDALFDIIPGHSPHLLIPETNSLFYLKAIRFQRTELRAQYVRQLYHTTRSETVKRACIECWCEWKDRPYFNELRNQWNTLSPEAQRMLWLGAKSLGDEGKHFRNQVKASLGNRWRLGIEEDAVSPSFASLYEEWA